MLPRKKLSKNIKAHRDKLRQCFAHPDYESFEKSFCIPPPGQLRQLYNHGEILMSLGVVRVETNIGALEIQNIIPLNDESVKKSIGFDNTYYQFAVTTDGDGVLLKLDKDESGRLVLNHGQQGDLEDVNVTLKDVLVAISGAATPDKSS